VFHLLKALSKVSEVTFVSATTDGMQNGAPSACHSLCQEVLFFPLKHFGWQSDAELPLPIRKWKSMRRRFRKDPVLFQWYTSAAEASFVEDLCMRGFDLIWMERLFFLSLLPASLKTRVVIDLDDLEHRRLRRELTLAKLRGTWLLDFLEFMKLRRLECSLGRRSSELIVCSETDRRILGGGSRVWVVPNGVEVPERFEEHEVEATNPIFLFVGYMAYQANIDAVRWFARQILPLIRREEPGARFFIVGRDPSRAVWELHDNNAIVVTGTISEVEPFMRQATVVVTPLRVGAGTRIKVLEAMANRRPVVSTSIGAEGLEVESGSHLLIANSASDFADACIQLLRDRSLRQQLVTRAFDLVCAKYDWSKIDLKVAQIALQDTVGGVTQHEENLCQQR